MEEYFRGHKVIYAGGYPAIYFNKRVVRIHRLVMEDILGRELKDDEVVHHIDMDITNYSMDNLICFASNADHVGFHKGNEMYFDSEGIAHCYFKTILDVNAKRKRFKICPLCGGLMYFKAKYSCINCYEQPSGAPPKEVLIEDLETLKFLEVIGRKYSVSGNTIKSWLKSYNLYTRKYSKCPDKNVLAEYLKYHGCKETAKYFGTSTETLRVWIDKCSIVVEPSQVCCIEDNRLFSSIKNAVREYFPDKNIRVVENEICRSILKKQPYGGYHWERTTKQVYFKN